MTKGKFSLLLISYCLFLFALLLYSFTQVDLNLTISGNLFIQSFQKFFQNIGYFNRPLSTGIYIGLLITLFIYYLLFVILTIRNKISLKQVKWLIIVTTVLLLLSYPAFSYDLFNYLFYGRIITHYGLSPYIFRALDFPADPWIRFMRWTHNTYPYGPFWLVLTTPLSFLGQQKFILTLLFYKLLMTGGFLLSAYSIYKIAKELKFKNLLLPLVLFAFNPLVIIESLISAHNDIVMIGFSLLGLYFLIKQKYFLSFFLIVFSILIKFVTIAFLPVWIIVIIYKIINKKFPVNKILLITCALLLVTSLYYLKDHVLQPWYFFWLLPFVILLNNKYLNIISSLFSLGLLLTYVPYLYVGNWNNPVIFIKTWIYFIFLLLGIFVSGIIFLQNNHKK